MGKFIKFEDASPALYPNYVRKSQYVEGYDGTKLALDYLRPVRADGTVVEEPLPVVLMASRGGRFSMERPNYPGNYFNGNGPLALYLIARGYVYVTAEMRGCGASFGVNDSFASPENRKDVAHLIRWICQQPWCDGNVGMMGGSNRSFIQMCTASAETPAGLKAITPCVSNANFYHTNFPNGVSRVTSKTLSGHMASQMMTKEQFLATVEPVDEDPNGDMAYEAYRVDQFPNNVNFMGNVIRPNMCRDSFNEEYDKYPNLELSAMPFTEKFRASGIGHHQTAGWFDMSVGSQIVGRNSWGGSILIGPWSHQGTERGTYRPEKYPEETYNIGEEHKRWFDYALKGKDNGWAEQPAFHYYTINAEPGYHWRWSDCFPLKETVYQLMFLTDEASGTVASCNDGSLSPQKPECGADAYRVDPGIKYREKTGETYDTFCRQWDDDMVPTVDSRSLTYTGPVLLESDMREMTGYPKVDLWVSSTISDGDFIAVLEEVFPDGRSCFVTDGMIRASHRTVEKNEQWHTDGVPFHPSMEKDVTEKLAEGLDKPTHLEFNLEPMSYVFHAGSRIRLTIFCAEYVTYQHPMYDLDNMPTIKVYRGGEHASLLTLPMIPEKKKQFTMPK